MSKKRLITSAVIVLSVVALFFSRMLTPLVFDMAFGALAVMAGIEVSRVAAGSGKYNNIYFAATCPAILYLTWMLFFNKHYSTKYLIVIYLLVMIISFLVIFSISMLSKKATVDEMAANAFKGKKSVFAFNKGMYSLAMLIYPATLFMTIVALNHLCEFPQFQANNLLTSNILSTFALVLLFAITMVCDSMAMVTGIIFKGKKLCPKISPNKTISGAIGGLVGGALSALVVYAIFMQNKAFIADFGAIGGSIWHIVIIGVIGAVVSQLGDITASYLKRQAKVKDYGNLFPGHGGVMDRMDGLIFNAAFILLFFIILAL